ncbi:MAG: type I 3-dehydroquinate dehydratase [Promethearchaeota archaeon]|nr:MAG: type I 3-dehydroquinate dehydratase [Candidatus Lokiarchaeota archaeon]
MKLNLCIPIPIRFTNINKVKSIIDKAIKSKPNLIELRFDYITDIQNFSIDFLKELLKIIRPHAAVIFTLRDSSEGGHLKINPKERSKILKILINSTPDYLDIEMNTDISILEEIITLAFQNEIKIIFSYHDFEKTLGFDDSIRLIRNFNERLFRELGLDSKKLKENIFKLIFTAQNFEDNLIALRLCKDLSKSNQKIISFCMGSLGLLSRIMCVLAGSFLTYTFLDEETASGQINIKEMQEIYNVTQNSS